MKIALLNTYFAPDVVGGAEVVTGDLARGLRDRGHDVVVLALGRGPARCDDVDGVRVHRLPLANVFWPATRSGGSLAVTGLFHLIDRQNPVMGARAAEVFDREQVDVLHTHNLLGWSTAVWRVAHARGIPIVHSLHDQRVLCHRGSGMDRTGAVCARRCLECRVIGLGKLADTALPSEVIGVSRWILDHHLAAGAFSGLRATVIHNAADVTAAPRALAPSPRLRVGFLGRLVAEKGAAELVASISMLARAGAPIELAVAGDGPARSELEAIAAGAPVRFLGRAPREALLDTIDVLAVPSRWHEPFGLVAVEALARGVPVLASRRGGLPEVVVDGATGWLYDPDAPNALAAALVRVLGARAELAAFGVRGVQRARSFTAARQLEAHLAVYQRATSRV